MAGIDIANVQVDWSAPWSSRIVGPYHIVRARLCGNGKIDVIFVLVLADVWSPYTSKIGFEGI
jgi:hypothetical protein